MLSAVLLVIWVFGCEYLRKKICERVRNNGENV